MNDVPSEHTVETQPTALTAFQLEVARLFFSLPRSQGFLLAGGAALAAQHLTDRPTQDLDFFTRIGAGDLASARDALEAAVVSRGWNVRRLRDSDTFCRLIISGPEELLVDLALDSPPADPPTTSPAGPTFSLQELAGRKLLALFDRAEARDFADVYALSKRFAKTTLIERAREIDPGFDQPVFADMLATMRRFRDDDLPVPAQEIPALRQFFERWQQELRRQ